MWKIEFKLHYWPAFTACWLLATFVISYVIAALNGHVDTLFPYISDTGTTPPESCIFGQMLNLAALFMFITMYIKYRQVRMSEYCDKTVRVWNNWGALFGALSCAGMSLVANFQETSEITTHFVGAFMAFGIGIIYFIVITYLSWRLHVSKFIKYSRLILTILCVPMYLSTMICSSLAFAELGESVNVRWDANNKGYDLHLAGTFSEWIMAILMGLYILTYTPEFKTIAFDEIVFISSKHQ